MPPGECPCQRCTQVGPATVETFRAGMAMFGYVFHVNERIGLPSWVYTVGLSRREHPEMLLVGVDPDVGQSFLGKLIHRIREGRHWGKEALHPFALAKPRENEFARTERVPEGLPDAEWDAWFALGTDVIGGRFPVVQVTFSDREGLFWDDVGCAKKLTTKRVAPGVRNKWGPPVHAGELALDAPVLSAPQAQDIVPCLAFLTAAPVTWRCQRASLSHARLPFPFRSDFPGNAGDDSFALSLAFGHQ